MKARTRQKSLLLGLFPLLMFGMIASAAAQADPAAASRAPRDQATESSAPDTDDTTTADPLLACTNVLCGPTAASASCCADRCKCNDYKAGSCKALTGTTVACWCTNDYSKWSTAPGACKTP